jgi:hypothetical protein
MTGEKIQGIIQEAITDVDVDVGVGVGGAFLEETKIPYLVKKKLIAFEVLSVKIVPLQGQ